MGLHGVSLIEAQAQVGARLGRADESETGLLVFGEVAAGAGVVELALEHSHGAGQVPALLAGGGQVETGAARGVEDVFVGTATQRSRRAVG